jgi:MFS family permease
VVASDPLRAGSLYTPTLLACFGITGAMHVASYLLATTLPLHLVDLGASETQVGLLFSIMTSVSMVLRPLVGGWVDRHGYRPVMLPGVLSLLATTGGLQLAATPAVVIALVAGLGLSSGLVTTGAGVLVAQASPAARRGEALSVYYVATSIAFAIGPTVGLALYRRGGMAPTSGVAAGLGLLIGAMIWSLDAPGAPAGPRPTFRWLHGRALPLSSALVLANLGYSSIYAFLPLYAIGAGAERHLWWFFTLFAAWIIIGRLLLRQASDRFGRVRVLVPGFAAISLSYFVLALRPSAPTLAAGAVLLASGVAVLYPTLLALLVDRTPESERGSAIGTLSGFFDLGAVVGSLLVGMAVEHVSYAAGFLVAAAGSALGLGVFLGTERVRRPG